MSNTATNTIDFGEKVREYSKRTSADISVCQLPKYKQSKEKAIALIKEKKYGLTSADFWILMNETKGNAPKMLYSGLIISHNACLKINDKQTPENKFKPSCVVVDKDGYGDSLVLTYCNDEQGIYEVGEVSASNCTNAYKYAMALKRLFDRVVLKITKIAYDGIYSEAESDEFTKQQSDSIETEMHSNANMYENANCNEIDVKSFFKQIESQKTMKELAALFNNNQEAINGDKEILKAFKTKKSELQKDAQKTTQGAA